MIVGAMPLEPDSIINNLKYAFDLLDTDRDGFISSADLATVLQSLKAPMTNDDIDRMIHEQFSSGLIDFNQFASKITTRYQEKQDMKNSIIHALKNFDSDGSGFIEEEQLRRIMIDLDSSLAAVLDEMISPCQTAHNDQGVTLINYLQFMDNLSAIM